jgi:hypothetical protein
VQSAICVQSLGCQRLGTVFATAEQIYVALLGHHLVGADLDGLDRDAPGVGPTREDQHVATIAVRRKEIGV